MNFSSRPGTGTVLEINAYPERLDLNDLNIRAAKHWASRW